MAIETIKNTGAYNDVAKKAGQAQIQPLGMSSNLSHVNVSNTSVTQTVTAVFKDGGLDRNQNDDMNRNGQATASQIRAAISEANFKATRTRCEFSVDEPTNRISIKVIDKETDKVIREIPAEESLEMLAKIWELAGLLVDEKR